MKPFASLKQRIKTTPLAIPYIALCHRLGKGLKSQSDEADILDRIISGASVPKTFIEFGFSGWEFNCVRLAQDRSWRGLLIDGDGYNITVAHTIFHDGIEAKQLWITLDTLEHVTRYAAGRDIGVLSIDVDGNDYWFLQRLIDIRPAVICMEINVTLGLRPITIPYDPSFDRTRAHESWEYYGASLVAIHHICQSHGYSLVSMSRNGVNAFFLRNDLLNDSHHILTPEAAFGPKIHPDGTRVPREKSWALIENMPFIDVTQEASAHLQSRTSSLP